MRYYTGIGARATPKPVCGVMHRIATRLEEEGLVLRSGGATGADAAFESGVLHANNKEIFLPWRRFNGNASALYPPSESAFSLARDVHPAWETLSKSSRRLHARNVHQVLGKDLQSPSSFLVCWTPDGETVGGTATAIRLASLRGIAVYNLGDSAFRKGTLADFVEMILAATLTNA